MLSKAKPVSSVVLHEGMQSLGAEDGPRGREPLPKA